MIEIQVDSNYDGKKISKLILDRYSVTFLGLSKFLKKKDIKLNGKKANVSTILASGDIIYINDFCEKFLANKIIKKQKITIDKNINSKLIAKIKQAIIYEDEFLIAINKPKDISVQGGSGISISLDDILPYISLDKNLHLVHRLDRDTTGVLLIGKGNRNSQKLIDIFRQKENLKKYYLAVVYGELKQKQGIINKKLIKKYDNNVEKIYIDDINGKEAITVYRVLRYNKKLNISLVLVKILTGRTHQIRVHFKHILHPLIGDFKYNKNEIGNISKTVLLHSCNIKLDIFNKKKYNIKAQTPKIFNVLFNGN